MTIDEFATVFPQKMQQLREYINSDDIKDIIGIEASEAFKENFEREGYTDQNNSFQPWQDVKRRDPGSKWYGHTSEGFSQARTTAKILTGSGKLGGSIGYEKTDRGARVGTGSSTSGYASVHQFGGRAKIFGKKEFQMPARPFIVPSEMLLNNIRGKIVRELKNIINK